MKNIITIVTHIIGAISLAICVICGYTILFYPVVDSNPYNNGGNSFYWYLGALAYFGGIIMLGFGTSISNTMRFRRTTSIIMLLSAILFGLFTITSLVSLLMKTSNASTDLIGLAFVAFFGVLINFWIAQYTWEEPKSISK